MKKTCLILAIMLLFNTAFAIEWINLNSPNGNSVGLDKDSIKDFDNHYFFNIKLYTNGLDDIIVTMQCAKTHAFCARINHYKSSKYEELNGDYQNITNNKTKKLEPITFQSRAYAAYKKTREIMTHKNKPQVIF